MDTHAGWDLYRTFLAVVREGSISSAAKRIGLAQPTAGRHIKALERQTGTSLFARSPRGLIPTDAALELIPYAEAMAAAAAAMTRVSSGDARGEKGAIRVTAGEVVGCEVLPPMFADFSLRYPQIILELTLSNRNLDLLRRDADIAVRMARPTQRSLVARRVGAMKIKLYAHRSYAEACGLPKTPEEVARHRLVGFDRDATTLQSVGGAASRFRREQFRFRCDSGLAQLAAVRAGVGIGGCYVAIARQYPDLVPVMERSFTFSREVWLVMHQDAKATRRIRLLFDHLEERLQEYLRAVR